MKYHYELSGFLGNLSPVPVSKCLECGDAVIDQGLHDWWHRRIGGALDVEEQPDEQETPKLDRPLTWPDSVSIIVDVLTANFERLAEQNGLPTASAVIFDVALDIAQELR